MAALKYSGWGFVGIQVACFSLSRIVVKNKTVFENVLSMLDLYFVVLSSFPLNLVGFIQHPVGSHLFERLSF